MVNSIVDNLGTTGQITPVELPILTDRYNVNVPIAEAAGRFSLAVLERDYLVDLELTALEAEGRGEIVSTPRVITANQKQARIEQGVEIPYQQSASSGATTVQFKKAVLSLEVTPQITPDNNIIMDLRVHKDNDRPSCSVASTRRSAARRLLKYRSSVIFLRSACCSAVSSCRTTSPNYSYS
jgi:type IV pilus assembly protein PilQ